MKLIRSSLLPRTPSFFNDFFDDDRLWNPDFNDWTNTLPAANITEEKDAFTLELAAPGMKKEDFKIDLDNGLLVISSEKTDDKKEDKENFTRREFSYNAFSRSFRLPEFVLEDKIKANYSDGVLTLTLPKDKKAKLDTKKEILVG